MPAEASDSLQLAKIFPQKMGTGPILLFLPTRGAELGDGDFSRWENTPSEAQGQAVWGKVPMPASCLHRARPGRGIEVGKNLSRSRMHLHPVKASAGTEVAALASPSPVFPVRCVA